MDQELIAYLEERFREVQEQFAAFREETNQQFAASREETNQQFAASREETNQQFAASREETSQRFQRLEEEVRHNGVEIEGLRGEIRQVAEGVASANERLDAFQKYTAAEFKDVRASIRVPFENLDGRVRVLESEVLDKNQKKSKGRPPS